MGADPGDRAMLWFNLIGVTLAMALLGSFFWFYGNDFVGLMLHLFSPEPHWP